MPMPLDSEECLGSHSVLIVGYIDTPKTLKTTKGCLIVRNSWGTEWGDKGYFYMPYEYLVKHTFDYWVMNK
jgi:C1A family cysteine protease